MTPHSQHDHLDALVVTASESITGEPALETTRVIIIAAEPCGCHVISANGFDGPPDLLALLMHVSTRIAEENGGSLNVTTTAPADSPTGTARGAAS